MFDIGWSEMAIIMLLALIIIGPKDLPRVARTVGQWVRKGRMLAREFQTSLEDMAKEAELDDVKKEIEQMGKTDLKKTVENTIDPKGELTKAFDTAEGASAKDTVGKTLNGSGDTKTSNAGKADTTPPAAPTPAAPTPEAKADAPAVTSKPAPKAAASPKKPAARTTSAAVKKPAAKKPAAEKPAATKPAARKTAARKPAAAKTAAARKPAASRKRAAKPASSAKSVSAKSGGDRSPADDAAMTAKSS